jgi:UV DNA damage endonuclease
MGAKRMNRSEMASNSQSDNQSDNQPNLGLVCITVSNEVRYRTITRKRLLSFPLHKQEELLAEIYLHNIGTLFRALDFCGANHIRLYRISSQIFPFADEPFGIVLLSRFQDELHDIGALANVRGIRLVIHPDQFVVLNSDSPDVVKNSIKILSMHARTLDYLEQPQSPWSLLELHGGKGKRADALVDVVRDLPPNIRQRLAFENDEYIYSAREILEICRRAGTPMVFDAHHHVCYEKIESYEHPSIGEFVDEARTTWPKAEWQLVHISNGRESFNDRRHSDVITTMPSAYWRVPWIEIEAKNKEIAIRRLQREWLGNFSAAAPDESA